MMVIKLEKDGKLIKSWEFDKVDDRLEKSILEIIDTDYDFMKRLMRERESAEVEG
jgi:hypothetical protein